MPSKTPLLALTFLAACASSGTSNPTPDLATPTRVSGPDFGVELYNTPGVGERLLNVSVDAVWQTLPGVYGAAGVSELLVGAAGHETCFGAQLGALG